MNKTTVNTKFKIGDYIVYTLCSRYDNDETIVIYKVYQYNKVYYYLIGVGLIKGSHNPYKGTEIYTYNPIHEIIDKEARLATEAELLLYANKEQYK